MTETMHEAIKDLYEKLSSWLKLLILMLPNLVIALLIFLLFYMIGRTARRVLTGPLYRVFRNEAAIADLLLNLVFITLILLGIFIGLSILKLDKAVTSLLAGAGIVGLAVGFAFQDIVSNFVSGVLLALRRPFVMGDIVESNGFMGTVVRLTMRTTVIRTFQGQLVSIPNKDIFTKAITNYTTEQRRRVDITCGISYSEDLDKVKRVVIEALQGLSNIDKNNIEFFYKGFGSSSIDFEIHYWISFRKQPEYQQALSDGIIAIKKAFDANNIVIPFPIRTLDFGPKESSLNACLREKA